MSRDEFDALVKRLEEISKRNPSGYNARVVSLVLLAYCYLASILVLCCLLMAGTCYLIVTIHNAVAIKLGFAGILLLGGLAWAVLRGLWVRFEAPEGLRVTRKETPRLFAMMDELREALECSPFHEVLVINDYNAAVVQVPRLGVFGWHRNYLLVGLPLMQSLAPDEFKAVLAHEFAHSSRGHGRFGNWLYRIRRSWERIFEQIARQQTRGAGVLTFFVKWFWPTFNAHAFVLARANEYEADACSVRLAGADAAAGALTRLPVDGSLLSERFWPSVFARVNAEQNPPEHVVESARRALEAGPGPGEAAKWLRHAFVAETNNSDTHPCLKDRLGAIGRLPQGVSTGTFPESVSPRQSPSAAQFFLEAHEPQLESALSQEWRKAVEPGWRRRHEEVQKVSAELAELDAPSTEPPKLEKLWQKAHKLLDLHDDKAALPILEQILALQPKHAAANFVCGRHHLNEDDPRGISFVESAVETDPMLTLEACNLLYAHFSRTGQRDKLRALEERMDRFQEEALKAEAERANITAANTFLPAELTPEQIKALQAILEAEAAVVAAAAARKRVSHFPGSVCFVIALRLKTAWWKLRDGEANQALINRIVPQVDLPGHFLVFIDEKNLKGLAKKICATPDSELYRRPPCPSH